jgi:hypothetical protein
MHDGVKVLGEASALGGFFALGTSSAVAGWQPMVALANDSAYLAGQVARVRTALAAAAGIPPDDVEERVAASVFHQGLVARLLSPPIACAALGGWVPRMQLSRLWWRPSDRAPTPVTLPDPHGTSGDSVERLGQLVRLRVVDAGVSSLTTAVERHAGLSAHITAGNIASCVVGAAAVLARQRPASADLARAVAHEVLRHPRLAEEGRFDETGRFRRASCCLYYRLPNAGLCGDCVLA